MKLSSIKSNPVFIAVAVLLLFTVLGWAFTYSYDFPIFLLIGSSLLVAIIIASYKIVGLWKRHTGKGFRFKVVCVFSLFVIFPCVIMAIFAVLFLEMGLQAWFHQRVQIALQESQQVAQAYLSEHKKVIEHSIRTMAKGLDFFFNSMAESKDNLLLDPENFFSLHAKDLDEYLTVHEAFRAVREAMIFYVPVEPYSHFSSPYVSMNIVSRSRFAFSLGVKMIKRKDLELAQKNGIFLSLNDAGDQVFAIVPIFYPFSAYLLVSRNIDKQVLQKINNTEKAVGAYDDLFKRQHVFAIQFIIIFAIFTLFLLCLAILSGLFLARQIIDPVSALINAAQLIKKGQVSTVSNEDMPAIQELKILISTFNDMVREVSQQKKDLMITNERLNERTDFIENVLSSISSGVMSLSSSGKIILSNQRAQELLQQRKSLEGKELKIIVEEFVPSINASISQSNVLISDQITIMRLGRPTTFRVHIKSDPQTRRIVITFDDITELIIAQKKTAWEDVARRIAHEVKNPLTPIMLSAERLRRKYLPTIENNPEIFKDCIETIIRQVTHIGKLITEFSSFSRMPAPSFKTISLDDLIHQTITLQREAYSAIEFIYQRHWVEICCDPQQIEQVLINVFKNAIESILEKSSNVAPQGVIQVILEEQKDKVTLHIIDNGIGLDQGKILTSESAFMTTKPDGSGLGLIIVQKIIYDHKGEFSLQQNEGGAGAHVIIGLMKNPHMH